MYQSQQQSSTPSQSQPPTPKSSQNLYNTGFSLPAMDYYCLTMQLLLCCRWRLGWIRVLCCVVLGVLCRRVGIVVGRVLFRSGLLVVWLVRVLICRFLVGSIRSHLLPHNLSPSKFWTHITTKYKPPTPVSV